MQIDRITQNPNVMGGKPCIRGLRVTVSAIQGMLDGGATRERILQAYPYLEPEDIDAVQAHATRPSDDDPEFLDRLLQHNPAFAALMQERRR